MLPDGPVLLTCPRRIALLRELIRCAYEEYSLGAPRPTYLPILIRLNVLNALAKNAVMMGFPPEGLCRDEFVSPYTEEGPRLPNFPISLSSCPDLFPFPRFRDNMLQGLDAGIFEEDELCMDLLYVDAEDLDDKPALIAWGESWDFRGWEVSVSFLRKWGWLIRGCPEMVEWTNYWREKRGEKRLVFQVS